MSDDTYRRWVLLNKGMSCWFQKKKKVGNYEVYKQTGLSGFERIISLLSYLLVHNLYV
jgi:hypothetical protein